MKRKMLLTFAAASVLLLCSCQNSSSYIKPEAVAESSSASSEAGSEAEKEISTFVGRVKRLEEGAFIVEPDKDYWEASASDEIALSISEVDFIPEVGDIVKITHSGAIMESYPAQISLIRIELISKASDNDKSEDKSQASDVKEPGGDETGSSSQNDPDISQDSKEQAIYEDGRIETSAFFEDYESLVDLLDMQLCEPWQMSEDSYTKDGFYVEFDRELGLGSIKNEANTAVLLYGCALGDSAADYTAALTGHNVVEYESNEFSATFFKKSNSGSGVEMLMLYYDQNGAVSSWYWNNWPEGDYDFTILDR